MAMMVGDSQRKRLPPQVSTQHQHDRGGHQQHTAKPVDLALAMEYRNLAHLGQQQRQRTPARAVRLIQKIIDQCKCSANMPPRTGPLIPANIQTLLK